MYLAQVSDTHLSGDHGWFVANWRRVQDSILDTDPAPTLMVNSGDLSINGFGSGADLEYAAARMVDPGLPWRAIPGNHDVGEEPGAAHLHQPASSRTQASWTRSFGPSWWIHDVEGWRLIGINAFLCGSGLVQENEQQTAVQAAVTGAPGPVGLFCHKPLFIHGWDDANLSPVWTVHPTGREWLRALMRDSAVLFYASGHLHQYRRRRVDGVEHVWAPATAFAPERLITPDAQAGLAWLRWTLEGDEVDVERVEPEGMDYFDLKELKGGAAWLYQAPLSPP